MEPSVKILDEPGNRNPYERRRTESLRVLGIACFSPTNRAGTSEIRTFTLTSNLGIYSDHCWRSKRMNHYWGNFPRLPSFHLYWLGVGARIKASNVLKKGVKAAGAPVCVRDLRNSGFQLYQRCLEDMWALGSAPSWVSGSLLSALELEEGHKKPNRKTQRLIEFPVIYFWSQ